MRLDVQNYIRKDSVNNMAKRRMKNFDRDETVEEVVNEVVPEVKETEQPKEVHREKVTMDVKVTCDRLNVRKGPGLKFEAEADKLTKDTVVTIVEVRQAEGSTRGWGKLKDGYRWISLDFVTEL